GEPAVTALCYCTDCQKWTGAAYTSNVVVPRTSFKVTKGSPKDYDAKGDSGKINIQQTLVLRQLWFFSIH
ncbi:hypothetical protein D6D27_09386, partial [Aureobasidium pullulans]